MENFESLGLPESLSNALIAMQYVAPTKIQAQTIPHALKGLDVLGTAQTGTGKTAAYGIPLITHLINSEDNTALVLTPTRELAMQVLALLEQMLGRKGNIKSALIIGGDSMGKQLNQLSRNPRIIVGTPGRINDHLARGTLKLNKTSFLVLDETDRMLDMGFGIQLDEIAKFLPKKRQTLMFSATLPNNIVNISTKYLQDAVRVSVGSTTTAADTIKQEIIRITEVEKYGVLLEQLELKNGSVIVFVKTKILTEKLADKLRDHGHSVAAIHGDLRQRNREKVIKGFRSKKHRILVATDVAARGLDISHVECVINHDLPQCEEDFIHRIGRTGRAGAEGVAISLITPQDHSKWRDISKMMNPGVKLDSSFDDPKGAPKSRNNRNSRGPRKFSSFGDRPARSEGFRSERPSFGDRPARSENRSKPNFGGRSEGFRSERPSFGDRPARSENRSKPNFAGRSEGFRNERPSFGDRPERSENRSKSNFAGRSESFRSERPSFGDRPERSENRSKPNFGGRSEGFRNERPSFGGRSERSARPSFGAERSDRPRNDSKPSFGGRAERSERFARPNFSGKSERFQDKSQGERRSSDRSRPERVREERQESPSRPTKIARKSFGNNKRFG